MSVPEGNKKNELFCSYAALLLSDCEADVSEENLNSVITAAGGSVPAHYASIFAKVAGMKSVASLVEGASSVSAGGPAAPSGGGGGDGGAAAPAAEAKKESSSSDGGGGAGMFEDDY
eukprot:TRINITY_DN233_c0_g1_i2.p2 TRINITY_DN233_c0_g1~~TRINITY_DN233_c0_g1_i2.p2  ORF type:complete len:117 (+),score=32.18 TRINITY_DN233_c0_g1_i2:135-485(+)